MKRSLLITVGCGLFASVALAQTPPAGTRAPSAQDFVNKVAISDMFEIQSSQLALSKEADADTKPFAEKMVQDRPEDIKGAERPGRGEYGQTDPADIAGCRTSENAE
jgi:putative membrane protein